MNAKRLIVYLLLPCLWAVACCKEDCYPPVVPPDYNNTKLEIVWLNWFYPDSLGYIYTNPVFWKDYIIYASTNSGENYRQCGIRVWHKQTGENHPAWQQAPNVVTNYGLTHIHLGGNNNNTLFIANAYHDIYALNLETGQRFWNTQSHNDYWIYSDFSIIGNAPIISYSQSSYSSQWSRYAKLDLVTGKRADILQTECGNNTMNYFNKMPTWTVNGGDTLLLFLSSGWNTSTIRGYATAYCFNVTQKRMEWTRNEDEIFENEGGYIGNQHPVIIENNKVVFQCVRSLFCFDIATGNLVWKKIPSPMEGYAHSPLLYNNDRIYTRCDGDGIVRCMDAQTGNTIWEVTYAGGKDYYKPVAPGQMDVYDGRLYFAGWGEQLTFWLYCLDANTGKLLWKDMGPTKDICQGVIIDHATGYLYCQSQGAMMCVDLKKTTENFR